jgi:cystathionine beta-lyase
VPGLHLAARCLMAPDAHALVPTPIYHHFKRALELAPRPHSDIPLVLEKGRWVLDLDALKASLTARSRLFFLCNPQNPGGTVFRRAELEQVAALTRDLVIVADEIHCDIVLAPGAVHVPIASLSPEISRRTVTLMSPNKAFNFPAAGCAWAIIEDVKLRRAFSADVAAHVIPSPSVFGFDAALAAYESGGPWLEAQLDYLRGNRDLVAQEIALPMARVEATYLAWIDCSSLEVSDPYEHFLKHGVALSPGAQFGAPRFVRLNFGTQRARLRDALKRMQAALRTSSRPSPKG